MRIVEKTEKILKLENSSMSIFCNLLREFVLFHFAVFGFSGGVVKVFLLFSSNPNLLQILFSLIWLLFAICFLIVFIVWIIQFWMGKYKKQKYLIFNKLSGKLLIKKQGLIFSYIKNKKISFIKQAEILKKYDKKDNLRYETRLVLNYGGKLYLDILNNNSLFYQEEIAQSINQFLNISPEPALIVEDNEKDNQVVNHEATNHVNDSPQERIEKRRTNYLENQRGWWF